MLTAYSDHRKRHYGRSFAVALTTAMAMAHAACDGVVSLEHVRCVARGTVLCCGVAFPRGTEHYYFSSAL